jgi:adenylate kinase
MVTEPAAGANHTTHEEAVMQRLIEPTERTAGVSACQNIVVVLRAPGSGKGTQALALADAQSTRHIASGDLLRAHRDRGTALGRQTEAAMERGALVPNELVIQMVLAELQQTHASSVAILDGFPRTAAQAMALDVALTERGGRVRSAIFLEVPSAVLVRRLSGRRVCPGCGASYNVTANPPKRSDTCDRCGGSLVQRSDDRREVVIERIQVYLEQTLPLVDYYDARGLLHRIDGDRPIDEIRAELLNRLAR